MKMVQKPVHEDIQKKKGFPFQIKLLYKLNYSVLAIKKQNPFSILAMD